MRVWKYENYLIACVQVIRYVVERGITTAGKIQVYSMLKDVRIFHAI